MVRSNNPEGGFIYIWGVDLQKDNELVLLFPNQTDSANQIEKETNFEWLLPTDTARFGTLLVSWSKNPLALDLLEATAEGPYIRFSNTKATINIWFNQLTADLEETTQIK
jgi:hypothetical protein